MKGLKDFKRFIESLKHLPTLSPIALRIVEIADDEKSSIGEMSKLIESDQALSSKILQIANNTLNRSDQRREVNTLKHASTVLGMNMIRSIALSLIVVNLFESSSDRSFNITEFWRHSAACAIASELLARRFSYAQLEEAFIAGLLHDLGKLIFFHWKKSKYKTIVMEANTAKVRLLELEEKYLEIGHTKAAKLLMEYWNFPHSLINAAWLHHQPLSEFGADRFEQLPFIVKCANSLCHIQRFGDSGNPIGDLDSEQLMLATGLSSDDLSQLSSEVLNLFEEVAKNYDWKERTPDLYLSAVSRANQELFQQQIELRATKQQLIIQQYLNKLIYELHESLSMPMPIGQALENVAGMLGEIIPYKRVMSFIFLEKSEIIEGWFKLITKSAGERIILPLNANTDKDIKQMRLREQVSLIEHTIENMESELTAGSEILKALHSPDLKVQHMYIGGKTIGMIMIELAPFNWSQHEKAIFLRKYALAAATALERLLIIDSLNHQMEERAQFARKIDDLQLRIYQSERLASVGSLAIGASTKINNPLAAISLKAQLLLEEVSNEKERTAINLILEQASKISKIIADLMDISRLTQPKIEPTAIDLVLKRTLCLMENMFLLSGIRVNEELEHDIPLVNADAKQMEQVFLNLTINAIQAMKKGGVLTIRINVDHEKQRLQIEFCDTGAGIQPKDISKLFEPFYTSKKDSDGAGLGLAICHSIIEKHNGEIAVSSQPGHGTTFTILLPLSNTHAISHNIANRIVTNI